MSARSLTRAARLAAFPALEVALFGLALAAWDTSPPLALALLVPAALALSFTLHITVHEEVHQRFFGRWSEPAHALMGLLVGMPFEGYRHHHFNHHRFDNALGDYSSTWRSGPDGPVPAALLPYALAWPLTLAGSQVAMRAEIEAGEVPADVLRGLAWQKLLAPLLALTLALIWWPAAVLYVGLVYVGWVFISVHNYGQHPPTGEAHTTSYSAPAYNAIFYNNGLHAEHHARPAVPHAALTPDPSARQAGRPHLLPERP